MQSKGVQLISKFVYLAFFHVNVALLEYHVDFFVIQCFISLHI